MPKTEVKQAAPTFELGVIPDQKKADALTKSILVHDFAIKDEDSYVASWAIVQRHDEAIKLLSEGDESRKIVGFDGFVSGLHKMWKSAIQLRGQFLNPIVESKSRWLNRRQEWRDKVAAANKKKADEEAAAKQKEQQKLLEKDAKKLDRQGEPEAASVLREQAKTLPAPVLPPPAEPVRQAGQVLTKFWNFTVEDYSKVPEAFRLLDPAKETQRKIIDSNLDALISKIGDKAAQIVGPAVKIFQDERESSRSTK